MKGALAALLAILAGLGPAAAVLADGSLPPLPYHYLHPPAALAGSNTAPVGGHVVDPVTAGHSLAGYVFTADGQAGMTIPPGGWKVPAGSTGVTVTITPVDTPPGLAGTLAVDGNAYAVTAIAQPGKQPARLVKKAMITLRWPHIPEGIDVYRDGRWRSICFITQATLTSSTIACPTATLGTFAAIVPQSRIGGGGLATPASRINPYIPVLAAIAVVIIAGILAYLVSRPGREPEDQDEENHGE